MMHEQGTHTPSRTQCTSTYILLQWGKNYFSVEIISSKTCHGNSLQIRQTYSTFSAIIPLTDDLKGSEVQPLAGAEKNVFC